MRVSIQPRQMDSPSPIISMDKIVITFEIFSPTASWNDIESLAKFDTISACERVSYHAISWRSKLLKYYLRHLRACFSPDIIHPATMTIPSTHTDPPKIRQLKKCCLTSLFPQFSYQKASIMSPVMKAKIGMAAPIAAEQIAQKIMRMIYFLLANRNRDKKDTELTVCY